MFTSTRTLATIVAATAMAVLLAVPAAAFPGPPEGIPGQDREDREPGNPIAHCLPEKDDDTDEPEPEPEPEPETDTVTPEPEPETDTATPQAEEEGTTDDEEGTTDEEEGTTDDEEGTTDDEEGEEDGEDDTRSPVADCVLRSLPDIVGNPHAASIVAVVAGGIANGFSDGTYRPQESVTRAQMATFLTRALNLVAEGSSDLSDVSGNAHEDSIDAVVEAGIAEGFADGTFRPQQPVTRAQMAAFLTRALDLASAQSGGLPDVAGHAHEAAINALVEAGIAQGFADGTFRPQDSVTRGQMATFLTRGLDL